MTNDTKNEYMEYCLDIIRLAEYEFIKNYIDKDTFNERLTTIATTAYKCYFRMHITRYQYSYLWNLIKACHDGISGV